MTNNEPSEARQPAGGSPKGERSKAMSKSEPAIGHRSFILKHSDSSMPREPVRIPSDPLPSSTSRKQPTVNVRIPRVCGSKETMPEVMPGILLTYE